LTKFCDWKKDDPHGFKSEIQYDKMPSSTTIKVPEHQNLDLDSLVSKGYTPVYFPKVPSNSSKLQKVVLEGQALKDFDFVLENYPMDSENETKQEVAKIEVATANTDSAL